MITKRIPETNFMCVCHILCSFSSSFMQSVFVIITILIDFRKVYFIICFVISLAVMVICNSRLGIFKQIMMEMNCHKNRAASEGSCDSMNLFVNIFRNKFGRAGNL